jgi:hypothetical protein
MESTQTIPNTSGGRAYRVLLMIAGVAAIVGIADQLRALVRVVMAGPSFEGAHGPVRILIILAGWAVIAWCAARAIKNAAPPTWAIVSIPILIWAYILWPN